MKERFYRLAALALLIAAVGGSRSAEAQYFGRNKVQYERFDWRILKTDHFDVFFYPAESLKVHDSGRQSERWYTRLSDIFRHQFDRKSLIYYADHPDFQQTNVVGDQPSEGIGGITEGFRTRVVMPFSGIYADDEHVIGHELVHVFQYNIAETAPGQGGIARLGVLPLWLIEGMAEYMSLGRNDALTAMWMRDAVLQDRFPTIKQLTSDPRFFPYRYGQALWAYIGGRWGDRAVVDVYRTALRVGWDQALIRALGLNSDSLSKDWAAANRALYTQVIQDRSHPDSVGRAVIPLKERSEYNIGPAQSPDGRYVAFFTTKTNLFGIDLVLADANTGRIIRQLAGPQSDGHFDAISFINSSGAWSPDGERFAFVVYRGGNNEIAILRTATGDIESRFRPADLGAVYNLAWSPDGRQLAFSGSRGGVTDLYMADVQTRAVRQLTNDRYADVQPTFSPDGRTIAFITDRTEGTSFDSLTFGELRLATIDVASGDVTLLNAFRRGKHINPQYSADARNMFFISDQDGVSDVYRMELDGGSIFRITRLSTGVSGISKLSPAMSIAHGTGRLMFTVFKNQGHSIVALEPDQLTGVPVDPEAAARMPSIAILPPGDVAGTMTVAAYLADPRGGLVTGEDFRIVPYRPSFALDALGQPALGVATGPFGTGIAGGISALWGDQLGDQNIYGVVQAQGTVKDIGGALYYLNQKRRVNWLAGVSHIPYLTGGYGTDVARNPDGSEIPDFFAFKQILQRIFVDQIVLSSAYPFNATRRVEFGLTGTRLAWEQQVDSVIFDRAGNVFAPGRRTEGGPPPLAYGQGSVALVGDNSFFGFTSPITGRRYRAEVSPVVGSVQFNTLLIDWRRYVFVRPVTFAARVLNYGRYGRDSDNYDRISPLFLGEETLIRGYSYTSIGPEECAGNDAVEAASRCPVFERLLGSRLGVINAELRIPLLGTAGFGLVNFPYLPLEVAPFFDAGLAWTADQPPSMRFVSSANATPSGCAESSTQQGFLTPCAERIPVFSTGVSFRFNIFGALILDTYIARPFQRPTKGWVWGVQAAPGW